MPNTKPYVAAALVCETVLQEKDSVLSAIRIVDTFYMNEQRMSAASSNLKAGLEINFLVVLKSGDIVGNSMLTLKLRSPSNKTVELPQKFPVHLRGGVNGASIRIVFVLPLKGVEFGLYWMDVYWNDDELTSIPFKLVSGEKPPAQTPTS